MLVAGFSSDTIDPGVLDKIGLRHPLAIYFPRAAPHNQPTHTPTHPPTLPSWVVGSNFTRSDQGRFDLSSEVVEAGSPPPPPHTHTHTHTLDDKRGWGC